MKHLTRAFKLLEITRSQPQYGYALTGIRPSDLSNLAEHHYLVSMIAMLLAKAINKKGGRLNVEKVLEIALAHDLGELFGGDIAMPYAIANPEARKRAKAFEVENLKFINSFMGYEKNEWTELTGQIMDARSDEALIAKIADYIEVTHYLYYMKDFNGNHMKMIIKKLDGAVGKLKDPVARREIKIFLKSWGKEAPKGSFIDELKYA